MDNIMKKNIFDDKDLGKLSPDYRPVNILLRMQLRRSLSKDTHGHGVHKNARKPVKKSKDYFNINKDILKLRNELNSIDLKNRITLKCIDPVKFKPVDIDLLTNESPEDEGLNESFFFNELSDDKSELVITNDTDFSLKTKANPVKLNSKKCDDNNSINKTHVKNEQNNIEGICKNEANIFKVECISTRNTKKLQSIVNFDDENEYEAEHKKENNLKQIDLPNNCELPENDLQTLLIMMALSSKPNNNEETASYDESRFCLENETESNVNIQEDFNTLSQSKEIKNILSVTPLRIQINEKAKIIANKFVIKWRKYVHDRKKNINEQRQVTLNKFLDKISKKKMDLSKLQDPENKAKQSVRDYNNYQHRYKVQKHIIAFQKAKLEEQNRMIEELKYKKIIEASRKSVDAMKEEVRKTYYEIDRQFIHFRYKVQKHIIAFQKAKLEEQNRMIEELKYNKIIEASRKSVDAMKEEVRKTYYEIDRQLKPKIKCLTNELKIHEIEEPSLVLHCLKVPQFLQRMEKRAREREEKHAIIRERRRQMEEERIKLKQQVELAKSEMDKEEKLRRMKELREKRKREKIDNIRRKQYAERMRALTVMADLHYEKTLTLKYGIRPLRILIELKRDNLEKANAHYRFQLKNNIFLHWMWYTEDMWYERNYKAENLYRKNLLQKTFTGFKMNHFTYILKKQVADDYYDLYVIQLVFRKFRQAIDILKKENEIKWQKSIVYHSSNLLFKTFTCWRTLPALNALKREQEARKARWREKVLQVVPDYTPPDD